MATVLIDLSPQSRPWLSGMCGVEHRFQIYSAVKAATLSAVRCTKYCMPLTAPLSMLRVIPRDRS